MFLRFNSTLVQLKARNNGSDFIGQFCFNSTLVQLKARAPALGFAAVHSFNSTLVQLKVLWITGRT